MFHTLWSERDLDFVFSPNFNSLWLSARAYGFLRWCRRAKKIIHIETEANVKHQNRLHLLVKENHMVHQKMPRESKNMQKVATRTCPQEKVSNTRMHKLSIDNVDIYISLSLLTYKYIYIHMCVSSNTFCAFFQVSSNISNIYPQKQPEIVAVSFQNYKNIMVFVFPTYVGSNASNVKNIEKMRITITSKIYSPD